jgi:predicted flap endonuclease-1-like 5' DNA nuclease
MRSNEGVANALDEVASLLQEQGANTFRVDAYRRAAYNVRRREEPLERTLRDGGRTALEALPGIGPALARAIEELILTGKLGTLERLRGEVDPEELLASVPGIGPKLAERLHHDLEIDTLADLEAAAHDGRLARLPGIGPKRIEGIQAALAIRLRRYPALPRSQPVSIDDLLDVDREYRERAEAGRLRKITPRRFNPSGEAWLPVLHTRRGGHDFTALYSNTARAQRLGKTRDWVVVYYDGSEGEHRATVVTATRGPNKGKRIVRGYDEDSPY